MGRPSDATMSKQTSAASEKPGNSGAG